MKKNRRVDQYIYIDVYVYVHIYIYIYVYPSYRDYIVLCITLLPWHPVEVGRKTMDGDEKDSPCLVWDTQTVEKVERFRSPWNHRIDGRLVHFGPHLLRPGASEPWLRHGWTQPFAWGGFPFGLPLFRPS